ncbi:hypothetical protein V8C34DRAFT_122085 [Trichoderma compactum]
MLVDDSSSAFSRHLGSGLILLCSVCPMSLNYWFHLVQSMACRCASLNVRVLFGLAAYAVCLRRSLCSFPGWRLFFFLFVFFFSFFLSLFSFPLFYLPGCTLRFSQVRDTLNRVCFRSRCQREPCGLRYTPVSSGLTRSQAVPGRSQVGFGAGIKSPAAGGDWSGYLGAAKQLVPLTLHYLSFSFLFFFARLVFRCPPPPGPYYLFLSCAQLTRRVPNYDPLVYIRRPDLFPFCLSCSLLANRLDTHTPCGNETVRWGRGRGLGCVCVCPGKRAQVGFLFWLTGTFLLL